MTGTGTGQGTVSVGGANLDGFKARMALVVEALGSIAEVARKCGFPESTVKKWVDGVSDPSRERCVQLARGTGVSLLWLTVGAGPMWTEELTDRERDALLIALGDPSDAEVKAAEARRERAISDYSAGAGSQELSAEHLNLALELAEEALRGLWLPRRRYADLLQLIYEALMQGLPYAEILAFSRPTAQKLAGGGNDGESGVVGAGSSGAGGR